MFVMDFVVVMSVRVVFVTFVSRHLVMFCKLIIVLLNKLTIYINRLCETIMCGSDRKQIQINTILIMLGVRTTQMRDLCVFGLLNIRGVCQVLCVNRTSIVSSATAATTASATVLIVGLV